MVKTIKTHLLLALAAAAVLFAGQPAARAVLVGVTPGGPHEAITVNPDAVTALGFTESWTVGSEQAPIPINYLATNGLWLTQLDGSQALTFGQTIQLHEFLQIGADGPSWDNWRQRFVTEGFNFTGGTLLVDGNVVSNGVVSTPGANDINFAFATLPAGTIVEIIKNIQWMGNQNSDIGNVFQGAPNLIQLEQFPTIHSDSPMVPEPATLALVGMGLSLTGLAGKFRKRRTLVCA